MVLQFTVTHKQIKIVVEFKDYAYYRNLLILLCDTMSRCFLPYVLTQFEKELEDNYVKEVAKGEDGCDKEFLHELFSATVNTNTSLLTSLYKIGGFLTS